MSNHSDHLLDSLQLPGGVKAQTWLHKPRSNTPFTTTRISRTIRTEEGEHDSMSFTHKELLEVAKAATLAYDYIVKKEEGAWRA